MEVHANLISSIAQVLEYCEHHRGESLPTADENGGQATDLNEWDQRFFAVDQEMLFEIIIAANYLNIKPLLCVVFCSTRDVLGFLTLLCSDAGCKIVANMIKGKTPEEIRKVFNIVDNFTPEEEVRGLTQYLKDLKDPPLVAFQAQIKKENVSHRPCPQCANRVLISHSSLGMG